MGQYNSTTNIQENERTVVVGLRPRCFVGCSGRSRGRQSDNFSNDAGLDSLPSMATSWTTRLSLEEWQSFIAAIRKLDDRIGPDPFLGVLMFIPLVGTHCIMLPGMLCNWLPALKRGMDDIARFYSQQWHATKGISVTREYKREGKNNNGVHCIRIEVMPLLALPAATTPVIPTFEMTATGQQQTTYQLTPVGATPAANTATIDA
ncbi:expressed unknown protein [Seminavis robusta]|uniref:Uncharacterized protein n=1 Tax=Seminavis robusta TaxID=568900 RepID=A0A9N8EC51_9STRA|nr:expressed unknown protein [Seminavis robusta]|eukprot:Sro932_g221550.1 n/a (205) ;mRNA; r:4939-5553